MEKIKNIINNTSKDVSGPFLSPRTLPFRSPYSLVADPHKQEQEKQFSTQPIDDKKDGASSFDPKTAAHQAAPGPAVPKDFSAQEEGTKEERRAKAAELNK
ncbi:hypothetical protein VDGL01_07716 [Verticillium dahliae]